MDIIIALASLAVNIIFIGFAVWFYRVYGNPLDLEKYRRINRENKGVILYQSKAISDQNRTIEDLKKSINDLKKPEDEKQEAILELRKIIKEKDSVIKEKDSVIKENSNKISDMSFMLRMFEIDRTQLREEVKEKKNYIKFLKGYSLI
ncbi:hypothetical protein [Bartonella sp. DGB2]|uniref:hypothetical protein n=1 Tax=Bartonella sp. DGB2 TaxID=3388426 RepID=UPI00398FC10F